MKKSPGSKKEKKKNSVKENSRGLFDFIKEIQYNKDPDYYDNLTESEKKMFKSDLFVILRGLSMNPSFIEFSAYFYRFLDIIPPRQFYKLLIEVYPRPKYKEFHKWIKSSKKKDSDLFKKESILKDILIEKFKVSKKEARDYLSVYNSSKEGKEKLVDLIQGFGYSEKEVEKMLK